MTRAKRAKRDALVIANLGLVRVVATRVARKLRYVDMPELISLGNIGLLEAAERFDPTRGMAFRTFADFRIRGAILDGLRVEDTWTRNMRKLSKHLSDVARRFEQDNGRAPGSEEMAKLLGVDIEEVHRTRRDLAGSTVVNYDDVYSDHRDFLATVASDSEGPIETISRREVSKQLSAAISELPQQQQVVLRLIYKDGLNLREVGEVLDRSESRACQIVASAMRGLRANLDDTLRG